MVIRQRRLQQQLTPENAPATIALAEQVRLRPPIVRLDVEGVHGEHTAAVEDGLFQRVKVELGAAEVGMWPRAQRELKPTRRHVQMALQPEVVPARLSLELVSSGL